MPKGKRGGARPRSGRRATFTFIEEWTIGGKVALKMAEEESRLIGEKIEGAQGDGGLADLFATLHAVPKQREHPDPAKRVELAAEYRRLVQRKKPERFKTHLDDIHAEIERVLTRGKIKLPAKTANGIRGEAVHHIGELLRRENYKVSDTTVDKCLKKYRALQKRLNSEAPLDDIHAEIERAFQKRSRREV